MQYCRLNTIIWIYLLTQWRHTVTLACTWRFGSAVSGSGGSSHRYLGEEGTVSILFTYLFMQVILYATIQQVWLLNTEYWWYWAITRMAKTSSSNTQQKMKKSSSTPAATKSASSSSHAKAAAAKCTPSTSRGKKSEKTTDPKGKPEICRCDVWGGFCGWRIQHVGVWGMWTPLLSCLFETVWLWVWVSQ